MKLKKTISIILAIILILCESTILQFNTESVYAAELKGSIQLNKAFSTNVEGGGDYLYSINIKNTGILAISGDFNSHSDGWIKILDSNGKIVATDQGMWSHNNITGKDNLSLVYQCTPGQYYIELLNNSDTDIYSVNMYIKYTTIKSLNNKGTLKGTLNRNESIIYKVKLPYTSFFNFKGEFYEATSLTVYVLDKNGVELDQDRRADGDWTYNNTTNLNKMNYNSITLKKGIYYIKINNQMDSNLSYNIKYSVNVPATKIKLNKTKLSLKKGKSFTLKATMSPIKTTDTIKWTSSNKKIATVSKKGVVKAKKKGIAYITATSTSGIKKKIKVTVK